MNCFEWQNKASDYLDGTLIGPEKHEADKHLDSCPICNGRYTRFRTILNSISSQPRAQLPIAIRKAPLALNVGRIGGLRRSRWEQTPWLLRSSLEGFGIAVIVLSLVAIIPRARVWYERSMERRLDAFNMNDFLIDSKNDSDIGPLARGKVVETSGTETDDFAGDESLADDTDEAGDEQPSSASTVRVGNSEIWRFIIKTDSPREIRPKVVQLLTELGLPKETAGLQGIEAPGGIQFDIFVPQTSIAGIKQNLEKLAGTASSASPNSELFTWYKNKSKRHIPSGKARMVVWLSQI